nr:MAG TPA: hypothetical protein [Caudoviricetes sp.]
MISWPNFRLPPFPQFRGKLSNLTPPAQRDG